MYIKYLKQNISKFRSQISGSFRRTPRHCVENISKCRLDILGSFRRTPWHYAKWLRNSPGKRYQRIRIRLTGEVETPSSPIRRQAPDAKYPDGMSAEKNSECETSGWNVRCHSSRRPPMVCPNTLSGHLLLWIPKNSPQSRIALVIKKLSKHQNLTQFD